MTACASSTKETKLPDYNLKFPQKIGGIECANPIWLAPLAGITFASFRLFHKSLGAGLVHTEMVSALGLKYKGRKTRELLFGGKEEAPCVLQLFGSNAEDILCGAEVALSIRSFEGIEVNMACPMPKVTKKGSGAKLMETPDEAARIISALKPIGLPVWSKIRIMPNGSDMTTCELCEKLFCAGADLIFIHGRTQAQRYEGTASRDAVEEAARKFPGLIGGSGDCYTPADFIDYLNRGCAAVLAARGVLRDAFLIPRTLDALGRSVPERLKAPTAEDQAMILLDLCRMIYGAEGEAAALGVAKRMLGALLKGFAGAARMRRDASVLRSWPDMEALLLGWRNYLEDA